MGWPCPPHLTVIFPLFSVCFHFEPPCLQAYIAIVMMRQLITEYLSFTQRERVAIIALIALIVLIYLLPRFLYTGADVPAEQEVKEFRMLERELAQSTNGRKDSIEEDDRMKMHAAVSTYDGSRAARLFYFDPNTLDEPGWRRLGLRGKTIGTILKYRSKGGRFYKAEDMKKIYGLHPEEYERIAPYIRINAINDDVRVSNDERRQHPDALERPKTMKADIDSRTTFSHKTSVSGIDINVADTTAFISLPGIGSKLAARIVFFRERLGGFYCIDQLAEVYGLHDSTFRKLRPLLNVSTENIRKLDINSADVEVLKQHPYIKWNIAKAIVAYREQHGKFKSLEELQQIGVLGKEALKRMLPYINIMKSE